MHDKGEPPQDPDPADGNAVDHGDRAAERERFGSTHERLPLVFAGPAPSPAMTLRDVVVPAGLHRETPSPLGLRLHRSFAVGTLLAGAILGGAGWTVRDSLFPNLGDATDQSVWQVSADEPTPEAPPTTTEVTTSTVVVTTMPVEATVPPNSTSDNRGRNGDDPRPVTSAPAGSSGSSGSSKSTMLGDHDRTNATKARSANSDHGNDDRPEVDDRDEPRTTTTKRADDRRGRSSDHERSDDVD